MRPDGPHRDGQDDGTRLNKFISESGLCSRREADRMIELGQVRVNGVVAEIGTRVRPRDRVEVKGQVIQAADKERPIFVAYNKPVGIECVTDPSVRHNIVDAVGHPKRIFPIGRLDVPSEGLIFLTNDGDSVNKILRAGNAHEKEYEVTVDKPVTPEFIEQMGNGIPILGTVTKKCRVEKVATFVFSIVLIEGLNRQIRRMCEYLGYEVTKLKRTRIMNISLKGLPTGEWRELDEAEVAEIQRLTADSSKTEDASRPAHTPKKKQAPPRRGGGDPRHHPRGRGGPRGGGPRRGGPRGRGRGGR
ncbi:MAG: 23S rRNA pseudouridine(2604) synthase RluF [Deltaproteobacteria bacterium]|jgi:23S rRNA pseudouridine2604 synthase|nr:23S rRNA pseudouridine(2604) synthase RluF [Deltaproteobacteria bacterium]